MKRVGKPGDATANRDSEFDEFIQQLTESQSSLRAYLLAALGNYDDASEVLQRTNLVLWRNARSFRAGAEFMPWAVTLAKYEVMSFYRDRSRDKLVFSENVAMLMLQTAVDELPHLSDRQAALQACIEQLPARSRNMIKLRYEDRFSILQMAQTLKRTENAVKSALARVRKSLASCISRRLNTSG